MVGLGLDYLWPLPFLPETLPYTVGFTLVALSFLVFGLVLREFAHSETSIDHKEPTMEIISIGPSAYSRNPVYVSMAMSMFGIAIAVDSLWILVLVFPDVLILHHFVVLPEEAYLERKFEEKYLNYKGSVRRWL